MKNHKILDNKIKKIKSSLSQNKNKNEVKTADTKKLKKEKNFNTRLKTCRLDINFTNESKRDTCPTSTINECNMMPNIKLADCF